MLVRIGWRGGTLTVEISLEVSQNIKHTTEKRIKVSIQWRYLNIQYSQ
jgi:hypothetical protein